MFGGAFYSIFIVNGKKYQKYPETCGRGLDSYHARHKESAIFSVDGTLNNCANYQH